MAESNTMRFMSRANTWMAIIAVTLLGIQVIVLIPLADLWFNDWVAALDMSFDKKRTVLFLYNFSALIILTICAIIFVIVGNIKHDKEFK